MENITEWSKVVEALSSIAWPIVFIVFVFLNHSSCKIFINLALKRLEGGAELPFGALKLGQAIEQSRSESKIHYLK
jgi:hypothetical protein